MKIIIVLLGLACMAYAQDLSKLLAGMPIPPIPAGMKLEDLKDAFTHLPPAMKDRLDSMAKSFGMSIDDVKQALDNPPEQLKQLFEQNTAKATGPANGDEKKGQMFEIPQMPDMRDMLGMLGIPPDASPEEIEKFAMERAKEMGFDLSNPEKMMETLQDQLKNILPGVKLDELMQNPQKALQATLKGMGIPTDNPKAMKKLVKDSLEELGIDDVDTDNMEDVIEKLKKKVLEMLDIDEKDDPSVMKEKVKKHLVEEMREMGIDVKDDDDMVTVQKKLTSSIAKELKAMGVEVESDDPKAMTSAIKKKLNEMGIKFDNMKELQNQLMGIMMQHAQSAFMHMMMPPPTEEHKVSNMPPKMPQNMMPQRPMPQNMMPQQYMPHMEYPNLNLEIEVNVEQPEHHMEEERHAHHIPAVMPASLPAAKEVSTGPALNFGDDEDIMNHIMKVRSGLRSGSMSEEAVEEMLDDLVHYRLKNTMLQEKLDRIEGMNHASHKEPEMHHSGNNRLLSAILNK
ncbi:hypothetical protein ACJMK2_012051 [Sinanodonta woodiana]|uniref:Uncharacterized protein n=1 Tax=Sinanodonta woodiana TaxID=1069815 RepID=A0ABD3V6Y9_SINWO